MRSHTIIDRTLQATARTWQVTLTGVVSHIADWHSLAILTRNIIHKRSFFSKLAKRETYQCRLVTVQPDQSPPPPMRNTIRPTPQSTIPPPIPTTSTVRTHTPSNPPRASILPNLPIQPSNPPPNTPARPKHARSLLPACPIRPARHITLHHTPSHARHALAYRIASNRVDFTFSTSCLLWVWFRMHPCDAACEHEHERRAASRGRAEGL